MVFGCICVMVVRVGVVIMAVRFSIVLMMVAVFGMLMIIRSVMIYRNDCIMIIMRVVIALRAGGNEGQSAEAS